MLKISILKGKIDLLYLFLYNTMDMLSSMRIYSDSNIYDIIDQYIKLNIDKIITAFIIINVLYTVITIIYMMYIYVKYIYNIARSIIYYLILKRIYNHACINNNLDQPLIIKHKIKYIIDNRDKLLITINNSTNSKRIVTLVPRLRHHMQTRSKTKNM